MQARCRTELMQGAMQALARPGRQDACMQHTHNPGTCCCRLIWALVHSPVRANQQRGLDLALAALDNDQRTQDQDRELRYFSAGGEMQALLPGPACAAAGRMFFMWCCSCTWAAAEAAHTVVTSEQLPLPDSVNSVSVQQHGAASDLACRQAPRTLSCVDASVFSLPCCRLLLQWRCTSWGAAWMLAGH